MRNVCWQCVKCGKQSTLPESHFPITHCGHRHVFPEGVVDCSSAIVKRNKKRSKVLTPKVYIPEYGPGTELYKIFKDAGANSDMCSGMCKEWQDRMNLWGVKECRLHRKEIVVRISQAVFKTWITNTINAGWVSTSISRKPWFKINDPVGCIVDEAIRLAVPRILTVYRKTNSDVSIGLGVNANLTATALWESGVPTQAVAAASVDEVAGMISSEDTPELVVFEGSWANPDDIKALAAENYKTKFVLRSHSQLAFLQIEPDTIGRFHDMATYSKKYGNMRLSGNSKRFTDWASAAWDCECLHLPNLYPLKSFTNPRQRGKGTTIRIGCFGKMRLQKHHTVSAAAVVLIAKKLIAEDNYRSVMLFVNNDDKTPGSKSILSAVEQVVQGIERITLHKVDWKQAEEFRKMLPQMDLCLQMSASETFNLVTADAIAVGVPSVCGPAIDWVPKDWHASIDDPKEVAEVAWRLINDDTAGTRGQDALRAHSGEAVNQWKTVLQSAAASVQEGRAPAVDYPAGGSP